MSDDTRKDRLIAAAASLVLAGAAGGLAVWLGIGAGAGNRDFERFSDGAHALSSRVERDITAYTILLMVLSGLFATVAVGLTGLALWMVAVQGPKSRA